MNCKAVGVGQKKCGVDSSECTPGQEIRAQFHGYKHISLSLTVHESLGASAPVGSENDPRNVCRNAWQTVVM